MAMALPLKLNFFAFAIPGVVATLAILLFILASQRQAKFAKQNATAAAAS